MFRKSEKELLDKADSLQKEAKRIINSLGIISILEKVSEPHVVGSADNGLMVWPDIDINAYMEEVNLDEVLDQLKNFALLPTIQKVQFGNFRELRRDHLKNKTHFPKGYYIGLRSIQPSGEWKIDIWFGEKGTPINDYNIPRPEEITNKQRVAILGLKDMWIDKNGGYRDGVKSTDFYKAVLEEGVRSEDDFKNYIKN